MTLSASFSVLLVRPPARHHVTIFPQKTFPLGLISIAAALRAEGVSVSLVDGFEGLDLLEIVEEARRIGPRVVGIGGMTAHAYDAMALAELLKAALPGVLVLAGGIHFSAVPDESLRLCPAIDLVVVGEGEDTMVALCQRLAAVGPAADWRATLHDLPGVAFLSGDGPPLRPDGTPHPDRPLHRAAPRPLIADLGRLPAPAFDLLHPERYRLRPIPWRDMAMIESSRGCPYTCTYCHTTRFWQSRWRPRPVEAVLDDLSWVRNRMGRRGIALADDSFATRRDRIVALCEGVLQRGLDVKLWAQCRVDDLYRARDLFPLMKRAGFYGLLIGFESGDQSSLDRWDKSASAEQARALAPALAAHFEAVIGTFFLGDLPTRAETFAQVRRFVDEVQVDIFIESPLTLFPPTIPLWREYLNRHDIPIEHDYDLVGNCKVVLPTDHLSQPEVLRLQKQNMLSFYGNPRKALHALTSGPYAGRQFATMFLSLGEDALRSAARARVPDAWRGPARLLRQSYKARHLAWAAAQPRQSPP